jgi:hypothetical protein
MSLIYKFLIGLAGFTALILGSGFYLTALLSQIDPNFSNGGQGPGPSISGPGPSVGAPAPILGAGLPLLVLAGGGYWIVRRYRRRSE